MAGAFTRSEGKWTPTITDPNGKVVVIGTFETREEAVAAYKVKQAELYPLDPAPVIDSSKHHELRAGSLTMKPGQLLN